MKTPLIFDEFKDYLIIEEHNKKGLVNEDNHRYVFRFENNYGASVIKHYGSYGYEDDLFELAVLNFEGDNYNLTYDTDITDDVLGYLNNDEVLEYLKDIKGLNREEKEKYE